MDFGQLGADLVRGLRGARTQKALSRALGYRSNVVFAWESGRDQPSLSAFFQLLRRVGREPEDWLARFRRGQPEADLRSAEARLRYLKSLQGSRRIKELSAALGRSRYVVGRWLSGQTEMGLVDFLAYVETTTLAVLDLVALLVDPRELPSVKEPFLRLEAARRSAIEQPWSHAIVHMVELPSYRALPRHQPGWFASRLEISHHQEAECLSLLAELGRLEFDGTHYCSTDSLAVDTRPDPDATRRLASFWMIRGAERVLQKDSGRYAFNTFGISRADFSRLQELQSSYFSEMRALIAQSPRTEMVCAATLQLFPLAVD